MLNIPEKLSPSHILHPFRSKPIKLDPGWSIMALEFLGCITSSPSTASALEAPELVQKCRFL